MIDITKDILSLSDFQRNAKEHIKRLKKTGRPAVLTLNGKASVVVQDAESYQEDQEIIAKMKAMVSIRRGVAEADRGEGSPAAEAFAELRRGAKARNK